MSRQYSHVVSNNVNLAGAVGSSLFRGAGQFRELFVRKDKRLFSSFFGSHHFRGDDNGGVGPGYGFWHLISGVEDEQYAFGPFFMESLYIWYRYLTGGGVHGHADFFIPSQFPRVYPEIYNLSRAGEDGMPFWPLNGIGRVEQPNLGGGWNGRAVQLSRLRIQGALKSMINPGDFDISYLKYWDNVRLVVVLDLAPSVRMDPGFVPAFKYNNFMHDLFLPQTMGVALNYNPQGFSRFRVLHDEVFSWTAQRDFNSLQQPFSKTQTTVSTIASGAVGPPEVPPSDSPAVFGFNLYEKGTVSDGVLKTGSVGSASTGSGGIVIGEVSQFLWPSAVPCIANTKTEAATNVVTAHMRGTAAPFDILHSESITAAFSEDYNYQDVRTSVIGPGGINIDIDIDLSRYYTQFSPNGSIVSGAIWLVAVSDNDASAFYPYIDRVGPDYNYPIERSGLDTCVTYVEG